MNELIPLHSQTINTNAIETVNARELHAFLGVNTKFSDWIKSRINEYDFVENQDFVSFSENSEKPNGGRPTVEYYTTLKMAKELSMVERNEKGKQARKYFIECEEKLKAKQLPPQPQPPRTYSEALRELADSWDREQALLEQNKVMTPKAEYFDELVSRNLLTNFRDTAKEFGWKQKAFIDYLLSNQYIYRDQRGKLRPYAQHTPSLFEMKEFITKNGFTDVQTLVTPTGRETFRLLLS